jgi:hypothetical protein
MNFDETDKEIWKRATPKEGMRLAFEYLKTVATDTTDHKATEPEPKEALAEDIEAIKLDLRILDASPLADNAYRAIHSSLMRAFEIGQFAGMIDARSEKPSESFRSWRRQKKSVEVKLMKAEASKAHALSQAKDICCKRTNFISQEILAKKILEKWEGADKPSRRKLIEYISGWDEAGEIQRNRSPVS